MLCWLVRVVAVGVLQLNEALNEQLTYGTVQQLGRYSIYPPSSAAQRPGGVERNA
eukprot:COSAG02_NODE_8282_length_2632_cov_51.776272_2_plen_55_part_00